MKLNAAFRHVIEYFERGDLVPLIVLVSAIHYTAILREHDYLVAAVSIGCLVDLGHYRWVKAAVRYAGENRSEKVARWFMVVVMSAIALNYQQRFYNDWWLSIPLPLLIASLAWLNQKDSKRQPAQSQPKPAKSEMVAEISEIAAEPEPIVASLPEAEAMYEPIFRFLCEQCEKDFATQQALNAHQRKHSDRTARNWRKAAQNGKGHAQ